MYYFSPCYHLHADKRFAYFFLIFWELKVKFVIPGILISLKSGTILLFLTHTSLPFISFILTAAELLRLLAGVLNILKLLALH